MPKKTVLDDTLEISIRVGYKGVRYIDISEYALEYQYGDRLRPMVKEELIKFIKNEKNTIELALEQLKDIEKMSEEL